mgnify:CR=1 FL=1
MRSSLCLFVFFLMIRRPPRSTLDRSSAASDVYKRQRQDLPIAYDIDGFQSRFFVAAGEHQHPDGAGIWACRDYHTEPCLLYTSPSPRDRTRSRMPSSAWKQTQQKKKNNNTHTQQQHLYTYQHDDYILLHYIHVPLTDSSNSLTLYRPTYHI